MKIRMLISSFTFSLFFTSLCFGEDFFEYFNSYLSKEFSFDVYFEDDYAYVNGTINNGDLVILGGASKIIAGKKINL